MIFNASGTSYNLESRTDYLTDSGRATRSRMLSTTIDSVTGTVPLVGGSNDPAPLSLTYNRLVFTELDVVRFADPLKS